MNFKTIFILFILFICASSANSANNPLEIIQPQASLTTASRYYKTYTGQEYKVRVGAIGGLYPFTFSITAAPSGMVIDSATGVITWSNPVEAGSPHNITVSITDSESTVETRSWTLTVSTSGFYFLDAVDGLTVAGGGQGTLASPWKTMDDLLEAGTVADDTQVYFMSGNYDTTGLDITSAGGTWERHEVGSIKPVVWLAWPGESPVINYASSGYADAKATFRISQADMYIQGFEFSNPWNFGLQLATANHRGVVAWCNFHDLRNGQDGDNSAFIMTVSELAAGARHHLYIHNNTFSNIYSHIGDVGGAMLKHYSDGEMLIEANTFSNAGGDNDGWKEGISLKAYNSNCYVRGNTISDIMDHAIGGSANINDNTTVEFNLVKNSTGDGVVINEFKTETGASYYYRNTFVSRVKMYAEADDGTFNFKDNVFVNADTTYNGLWYYDVTDPTKITRDGDLSGIVADGIVDASGNLQGAYLSYLGTKGYQISDDDTTAPTITSAAVNGTTVTITADETIVTTGYDANDCALTCVTAGTVNLTSPTGTGASRTLTGSASVANGDTCTLGCTLGTDDIEDAAGNDMITFSGLSVAVNTPMVHGGHFGPSAGGGWKNAAGQVFVHAP